MLGNDTAALLWVVFKQKTLLHPVILLGYFKLKQPNVLNFEAATNAQELRVKTDNAFFFQTSSV